MADDSDAPQRTLEPLDYLTRSEHRVQVLQALTESIPKPGLDMPGYEPRELREMTGASEATVSRILNEFDDRGWAERDVGGEYRAKPLGQSIAIGFGTLLNSMEAIQHLGEAVALLPLSELTIGLEHFRDATVREPKGPPNVWFSQYIIDLLERASRYYFFAYVPPAPNVGDVITERTKRGTLEAIQIFPKTVYETWFETYDIDIERVKEAMEGGNQLYTNDDHLPCNLLVFDETVVIENSQVDGVRDGTVIESQNGVVREWALYLIDRYRVDSTELTVEDLPE